MEYKYFFKKGQYNIMTPGVDSLADIKNEILRNEPDHIVMRSTYPNGFVITMDQRPMMISVTCNRELIVNEDSTLTAPTAE